MSEAATASVGRSEDRGMEARRLPTVIAIDGSAASGKSSIGRLLAAHLGYPFLDTGVMYRAMTYAALEAPVDVSNGKALSRLAADTTVDVTVATDGPRGETRVTVNGQDATPHLRRADVEDAVSLVSRVPAVREALVRQQREIAARGPIVMVGRDIGTVVLPRADIKFYLDASLDERAARRHREFESLGRNVTREEVLDDIRRRDRIDSERNLSPLRPADDAIVIGTDGLSLDEVLDHVIRAVEGGI